MVHLPFLAHPFGWLILGLGGYALYRSGKKRAEQERLTPQAAASSAAANTPVDRPVDTISADNKEEN